MKIAISQFNYTVGALQSNKLKIVKGIHKAKQEGADLVVFASHAISGTFCYELLNLMPFMEACENTLKDIASQCHGISVILGVPLIGPEKRIIAAAYLEDGKVVKTIGQKHMISREEKIYFTPAGGVDYVTVKGQKVVVVLADDMSPMIINRKLDSKADVVVNIHAHPYYRGVIQSRYEWLQTFAYEASVPLIMVNHLGGQVDNIYDGSSCAFNKEGKPLIFMKKFEEDFAVIDTDGPVVEETPKQWRTENVYKAMKLGLGDYFHKNGFKKACLGLSGGIDSAVVLAMAVDVLGSENVRVMMLPSEYSGEDSLDDAIQMAHSLGVEFDVIPIDASYTAFMDSMKPVIGGTNFDHTEENLQARIRTTMIMALANKFGYLMLNTTNKTDLSMGYGATYGGMGGMFSILGDLYKCEVYDLARYINIKMRIIPESIMAREPSGELRPGQKDTDTLLPYDIVDAILYRFSEEGQGVEEITDAGFEFEHVKHVLDAIKINEFKRRQLCPILRFSARPYGTNYLVPLINKFILPTKEDEIVPLSKLDLQF